MKMFTLFLVLFAIGAQADHCSLPSVHTVSGLASQMGDGQFVEYKYQYFPGRSSDEPVVVLIPGGPGQTGFGERGSSIPAEYGLIQLDPRGIGCNQPAGGLPEDRYFATEKYVNDIYAALKHAGVTDRTVIFGISYGTIVATRLAAKMEAEGHRPVSVVLEGVLGRFFDGVQRASTDTYIEPLQDLIDQLSPESVARLNKIWGEGEAYLGIDPEVWFGHFQMLAMQGYLPGYSENLIYGTDITLSGRASADQQQVMVNMIRGNAQSPLNVDNDFVMALYGSVACSEIIGAAQFTFDFIDGRFVRIPMPRADQESAICQPGDLTEPYDSADYQVQAPIYYMQGESDPATPHTGALYHFDQQRRAQQKYFVSFPRAGHNPLSILVSIMGGGCHTGVWHAMAEARDPEQALNRCQVSFNLL